MPMRETRLKFLLIADGPHSTRTVSEALRQSGTRCRLLMVPIGADTVPYLRREGRFRAAPVPDIVLFDAVDPRPTTVRMLQQLRADRVLRTLPLVVLTNDESRAQVEDLEVGCERHPAFAPVDLANFLASLNAVDPARFTRALSLLDDVGVVLVRMPPGRQSESGAGSTHPGGVARKVSAIA